MTEPTETTAPEEAQTQETPAPEAPPVEVPNEVVNLDARSQEEREKEGFTVVTDDQLTGSEKFINATTLTKPATAPATEAEAKDASAEAEQPDTNSKAEGPPDGKGKEPGIPKDAKGDGDPENSGDHEGEFPDWVRRRLARTAKQQRRQGKEALAAKDAEIARLKKLAGEDAGEATEEDSTSSASAEATGEGDTEEDGEDEYYPVSEDYPTEREWMNAVTEFHKGVKVEKPTATAADTTAKTPVKDPAVKAPAPSSGETQLKNMLGVFAEKLLTEAPDIADEFIELWNAKRFGPLSPAVIDHMIDSDEGTAIAKMFVEKPYTAGSVSIKAASKQVQAVRALLAKSKGSAPPPKEESNGIPVISPLRPATSGRDNSEYHPDMSADDYLAMRQREENNKRAMFVRET